MNLSLRQHIQSLGNVFSEGVAFDEELVTLVPASNRTAWSVRPHVGPTDVSKVSSGMDTMSESRTINSDAKAVFSRAIKQGICSRVDLFYYSDIYMSRCVKELQDIYQVFPISLNSKCRFGIVKQVGTQTSRRTDWLPRICRVYKYIKRPYIQE